MKKRQNLKWISLKALVVLAFSTSFFSKCFSQKPQSFVRGYLVTLQGDTLRGFVDNGSEAEFHTAIHFKESPNSAVQNFTPSQLIGFAHTVPFAPAKVFESKLSLSCNVNGKNEIHDLFLERMVTGVASLYFFVDDWHIKHYFLTKGDKILELKYQYKIVKTANGTSERIPDTVFNGVLNLLLSDCKVKSYDMVFSERNIIRAVRNYNSCLTKPSEVSSISYSDPYFGKLNKGYIVTLKEDTVNGFIDYIRSNSLYQKIDFRQTEKSPSQIYTPSQIKAFGLAEGPRVFVSKRNVVYYSNGTRSKEDRFIEVLIRGKASLLYMLDDQNKKHNFVQKDSLVLELQNKETIITKDDGSIYKKKSKEFNGVFNFLLGDCDQSTYDVPYSQKEFVKQVISYNECRYSRSIIFNQPRRRIYFGYMTMLSSSMLSQSGVTGFDPNTGAVTWSNYQTLKNISPTLGFYFDMQQPRSKHWMLNLQGYVLGRHFKGNGDDIQMVSFELPISIKYAVLLSPRVRPNLSLGLNIVKSLHTDYNTPSIQEQYSIVKLSSRITMGLSVDFFGKGGRQFFVGFRMEAGKSIINALYHEATMETYNFYVGTSKLVRQRKQSVK